MAILICEDGSLSGELAGRECRVGGTDRALAQIWNGTVATVVSKKLLDTHDCCVCFGGYVMLERGLVVLDSKLSKNGRKEDLDEKQLSLMSGESGRTVPLWP